MSEQTNGRRHIVCFTCICECYDNYLKDEDYWCAKRRYGIWYHRNSKWELQFGNAYQFISTKAFLKHHEIKHDSDKQPIRLLCKKCLETFTEPGAAKIHEDRIPVEVCEDEVAKFSCNQCPNECFIGKTAFLNHASSKHRAHYDYYDNGFNLWDARKLTAPNMRGPGDCMFWSWTGRNFSPVCSGNSSMKPIVSPGCNYVPNWPYSELFACGLCSFVNHHKVRVRNHLKSKHSVLTADATIKRGDCENTTISSGEEESSANGSHSLSDDDDDNLAQQLASLSLTTSLKTPTSDFSRRRRRFARDERLYYCNKLYRCKKCSRTFDSKHAVFQHADKLHAFKVSEEFFPYQLDDFCCSFCSRQFGWVSAVKEHEKKQHSDYVKQ